METRDTFFLALSLYKRRCRAFGFDRQANQFIPETMITSENCVIFSRSFYRLFIRVFHLIKRLDDEDISVSLMQLTAKRIDRNTNSVNIRNIGCAA